MTEADRKALSRIAGAPAARSAGVDDLQAILLQVVFALLMVFMIAYFVFVDEQKKERVEEVMALNRQKLVLALEKTAEDMRVRYGLNALMTQGVDGRRTFEASDHVRGGKIVLAPAAAVAFSAGGRAASSDYADAPSLAGTWRTNVFCAAGLSPDDLSPEEAEWFEKNLSGQIEAVRTDVRGVQRALAARLQRQWVDDPSCFAGVDDPGEIADLLRAKSLSIVAGEIGGEVLE